MAPRVRASYTPGTMQVRRIGFIGGGNMATALISGLLSTGAFPKGDVRASDVSSERTSELEARFGITTLSDNRALVDWAECLVLAVKPQAVEAALGPVRSQLDAGKLLISVCAGVTIERLVEFSGPSVRVVRAMPNTPALVLKGATAMAAGPSVDASDQAFASDLFGAVGKCWWVAESLLDAVTGLSGSGPAYVMLFIEALADGGVRSGLPRDVAQALAIQTVLGSAHLASESELHPGQLKDRVTSPAGTTIEGVFALERGMFRGAVMDAVCVASERSRALGSKK